MLLDHVDGILNYCRTKVRLGVVEAINGNIISLLRRGRGDKNPYRAYDRSCTLHFHSPRDLVEEQEVSEDACLDSSRGQYSGTRDAKPQTHSTPVEFGTVPKTSGSQ
jgi:hypothetical protein